MLNENFQKKAKMCKISLPLEVNKDKLLQRMQTNKGINADIDESILEENQIKTGRSSASQSFCIPSSKLSRCGSMKQVDKPGDGVPSTRVSTGTVYKKKSDPVV